MAVAPSRPKRNRTRRYRQNQLRRGRDGGGGRPRAGACRVGAARGAVSVAVIPRMSGPEGGASVPMAPPATEKRERLDGKKACRHGAGRSEVIAAQPGTTGRGDPAPRAGRHEEPGAEGQGGHDPPWRAGGAGGTGSVRRETQRHAADAHPEEARHPAAGAGEVEGERHRAGEPEDGSGGGPDGGGEDGGGEKEDGSG